MTFRSIYTHGFLRVAACTLTTAIAEPSRNAESILAAAQRCHDDAVGLAVFPELCLSGYALEDLFLQDALQDAVGTALDRLVAGTRDLLPVLVVGAPLRWRHRLYNAAVVIHRGAVLGVVPKSYLPNYREFYEKRHFAPGAGIRGETIRCGAAEAPFGTDLLFAAEDLPGFTLGVEICEDMWVPEPPAGALALAGATVLANLSGSPITIGRARSREFLCQGTSARCLAAYVYAAAGAGESTTDLSWDGQTVVYENAVQAGRGRALRRLGPGHGRRRRPRPPAPGAPLDGVLRRQRAGPGGGELPHRRVPARPAPRRRRVPPPDRAIPLRAERPRAPRAGLLRGLQHPGGGAAAAALGHRGRGTSPSGCRAGSIPPMR